MFCYVMIISLETCSLNSMKLWEVNTIKVGNGGRWCELLVFLDCVEFSYNIYLWACEKYRFWESIKNSIHSFRNSSNIFGLWLSNYRNLLSWCYKKPKPIQNENNWKYFFRININMSKTNNMYYRRFTCYFIILLCRDLKKKYTWTNQYNLFIMFLTALLELFPFKLTK